MGATVRLAQMLPKPRSGETNVQDPHASLHENRERMYTDQSINRRNAHMNVICGILLTLLLPFSLEEKKRG
jgi:hypothetical protein